ncbi:MAG: alpha/beta hydrolase [Erysipelotrichaceae bacterium]|nr:alpha/beta hydrolase [Erysipelotrichaceae bacterium]MBQ3322319.1 alpha/beta hydrolase [Bacillota bacterium]
MKKAMKIIGVIALVITAAIAALIIKGFIESKKSYIKEDYYADFSSSASLEQKYSKPGEHEVSVLDDPSNNEAIRTIRFWYPTELNENKGMYPVIVVVNASGTPAFKYEPWFKRLASWGFIVVGNEDPQAGTGETTSIMLDYLLNLPQDHLLNGRLDTENIGIVGFSQGGAGALAAVTMYDNGAAYKTIFTGSAAYPFLAENMGWKYDVSRIRIPYFMVAGTGETDDKGVADITKEFGGVAPLASLIDNYEAISDDVLKVRARATGAEHEDMLARSDGYMTAWMLWQLRGDEEAAGAFIGEDAEILHNNNWQDVEKNK